MFNFNGFFFFFYNLKQNSLLKKLVNAQALTDRQVGILAIMGKQNKPLTIMNKENIL